MTPLPRQRLFFYFPPRIVQVPLQPQSVATQKAIEVYLKEEGIVLLDTEDGLQEAQKAISHAGLFARDVRQIRFPTGIISPRAGCRGAADPSTADRTGKAPNPEG